MFTGNDSKGSPKNQGVESVSSFNIHSTPRSNPPTYTSPIPPTPGNGQVTDYQKVKLPMPRISNSKRTLQKRIAKRLRLC